nr:PIN domain-containing protein [Microbacterium testaceum]
MVTMLLVVVDSNSLHRDPWMTRDAAKALVELAGSGACEIVYPQVVMSELRRQSVDSASRAHESAATGVRQMGAAGVDVAQTAIDLRAAHDRIEADIDSAFAELLARDGVRTVSVPAVPAQDLLDRDLDRRRPFLEIEQSKKKKSLGFRDVLIWESVLHLLQEAKPDESVLFVTFDKGFLADDEKSLHPHLMEDLDRLSIARDSIHWSRSIAEANTVVRARVPEPSVGDELLEPESNSMEDTVEPEHTGPIPHEDSVEVAIRELREMRPHVERADLVKAATDALYDLVYTDVPDELVPAPMEGAVIAGIDQTTEFTFEEDPASPDTVVARSEAVLTVEGGVYRGDWFADEGAVTISGQLNDHYLEGSAEVEATVIVELNLDEGLVSAVEAYVEEAPLPPDDPDNMLEFDFSWRS